jgi:hypothetical protein
MEQPVILFRSFEVHIVRAVPLFGDRLGRDKKDRAPAE